MASKKRALFKPRLKSRGAHRFFDYELVQRYYALNESNLDIHREYLHSESWIERVLIHHKNRLKFDINSGSSLSKEDVDLLVDELYKMEKDINSLDMSRNLTKTAPFRASVVP